MNDAFTTRELGDHLGRRYGCDVPTWKVRRLFELGILPEPAKFGRNRVILPQDVPKVIAALRARGWLPSEELVESEA